MAAVATAADLKSNRSVGSLPPLESLALGPRLSSLTDARSLLSVFPTLHKLHINLGGSGAGGRMPNTARGRRSRKAKSLRIPSLAFLRAAPGLTELTVQAAKMELMPRDGDLSPISSLLRLRRFCLSAINMRKEVYLLVDALPHRLRELLLEFTSASLHDKRFVEYHEYLREKLPRLQQISSFTRELWKNSPGQAPYENEARRILSFFPNLTRLEVNSWDIVSRVKEPLHTLTELHVTDAPRVRSELGAALAISMPALEKLQVSRSWLPLAQQRPGGQFSAAFPEVRSLSLERCKGANRDLFRHFPAAVDTRIDDSTSTEWLRAAQLDLSAAAPSPPRLRSLAITQCHVYANDDAGPFVSHVLEHWQTLRHVFVDCVIGFNHACDIFREHEQKGELLALDTFVAQGSAYFERDFDLERPELTPQMRRHMRRKFSRAMNLCGQVKRDTQAQQYDPCGFTSKLSWTKCERKWHWRSTKFFDDFLFRVVSRRAKHDTDKHSVDNTDYLEPMCSCVGLGSFDLSELST